MIAEAELVRLWRDHAGMLRLLAVGRCPELADDCVQIAFIRLAAQQPVPDEPLAWLVRVVRNEAISQSRSLQRRRKHETAAAMQTARWFESPADDGRATAGDLCPEEVQAVLQTLPDTDREIVVAHLWGGLPFRQIAEMVEWSPATTHRVYQQAIERMRNQLMFRNQLQNDE